MKTALKAWFGNVEVVREGGAPMDPSDRYIFGYTPHGLFPIGKNALNAYRLVAMLCSCSFLHSKFASLNGPQARMKGYHSKLCIVGVAYRMGTWPMQQDVYVCQRDVKFLWQCSQFDAVMRANIMLDVGDGSEMLTSRSAFKRICMHSSDDLSCSAMCLQSIRTAPLCTSLPVRSTL